MRCVAVAQVEKPASGRLGWLCCIDVGVPSVPLRISRPKQQAGPAGVPRVTICLSLNKGRPHRSRVEMVHNVKILLEDNIFQ